MKKQITLITCISILILSGTVSFTYANANDSMALVQEAPVFAFGTDYEVVGMSKLIRHADGIAFELETQIMTPDPEDENNTIDLMNHAVTVWCVVFNKPTNCIEPGNQLSLCGLQELQDADGLRLSAMVDLMRVDGDIVDNIIVDEIDGKEFMRLSGTLPVGDNTESILPPHFGLRNPLGADIHFVIRTHGTFDPNDILTQIHTFEGVCPECVDLQFNVFVPPDRNKLKLLNSIIRDQ